MQLTVKICTGMAIPVKKGQLITVVDAEGGQVVDFFAEAENNPPGISFRRRYR